MLRNLRMGQQFQVLVFVLVILLSEACETIHYGLDDPRECNKIRIKWLKDDQCAIIVGKITAPLSPLSDKNCQMIFGASSTSKYQFVQLTFDTFYINSCDVVLEISDSPSPQFDRKVQELAMLTCQSPNPGKIYSHEGNHVMLSLRREDKYIRNYNFRINASLSAGPPLASKSSQTILIIVGLIASVILVGCGLTYKYYLMRRARWLESTSVLDVQESSTPRVRHRFPDDIDPHVHIICDSQNGTVVLGGNTEPELDYPPPSYEEAISMPSQSPARTFQERETVPATTTAAVAKSDTATSQ